MFNAKNVDILLGRRILKIVNIFSFFYSPFAVIDAFYDEFFFIFRYLPDGFSFSAPYYFFWNAASLALIAYYFIKFKPTLNREINQEMLMKFKITEKEKEIALYILKGYLNKEICDKTFTSITTVKKHIYNLFQKTNAKNRVELINILSGKIRI